MPTYEFKCKQCGERFEIVCHWDERDEKAVCPQCGGKDVETVLTASFKAPPIHPKPF
jgi:putative FmdB family regulatory protein